MLLTDTLTNRLDQREHPDAADIFGLITTHALRGNLNRDESILFRAMSPGRARLFLLQGNEVIVSANPLPLPLDAIESAARQNRHAFYLHNLDSADTEGIPDQCAYHAQLNPASTEAYTLGMIGSRNDMTRPDTQRHFHQLVESVRDMLDGFEMEIEQVRTSILHAEMPTLLCDRGGRVIFANASFTDLVGGAEHQAIITIQEVPEQLFTYKRKLSNIHIGRQPFALVSFETEQEKPTAREQGVSAFLFSRLRDKISTCSTAAEFLFAALQNSADAAGKELSLALSRELRQMNHFLTRTEVYTMRDRKVVQGVNISGYLYSAVERARQILGAEHEISVQADHHLICDCPSQGLDILIETALWQHLQDQRMPTQTIVAIYSEESDTAPEIRITTGANGMEQLRLPSRDWQEYLEQLASQLNVRLTTGVQNAPPTLMTQIQCNKVRNYTNGIEGISRAVGDFAGGQ